MNMEPSVPASERRLVKLETGIVDSFDRIGECENTIEGLGAKVHDIDKRVDAAECKVDAVRDKEAPRVDVLKPKEFKGSRKAEDIDNFLWHMERYFEAIKLDDVAKVSTASLYLVDLAATWWRRKHNESNEGCARSTRGKHLWRN
ncbi:hypothetical protein QQ045_009383 [Rhodiola kirilowii]